MGQIGVHSYGRDPFQIQNQAPQHIHINNAQNVNVVIIQGDQTQLPQHPQGQVPQAQISFETPVYPEPSGRDVYQSLEMLKQAEGSSSQAQEILKLIQSTRRPHESLQQAAQAYIILLEAEGGASNTDQARENYTLIDRSLRSNEGHLQAAQAFALLLEAEGGASKTDQARENYAMIDRSLRPGEHHYQVSRAFSAILDAEGGSSKTDQARENFHFVNQQLNDNESQSDALYGFAALLRAEGASNTDDARGNFSFIDQRLNGRSRVNEIQFFLDIFKGEGRQQTSRTRNLYAQYSQ